MSPLSSAVGGEFRRVRQDEESLAYRVICDSVAWQKARDIALWDKPLPAEVYAARQTRGENFALSGDAGGGKPDAVVSLVRGVPAYWRDDVPDPDQRLWLCTLATAPHAHGRGAGRRAAQAACRHAAEQGESALFLDCKPGFLESFYAALGFTRLVERELSVPHAACCAIRAVLMRKRLLPRRRVMVDLAVRPMVSSDPPLLAAAFADMKKSQAKFERVWQDNEAGNRITLVGELDAKPVAYVNVVWRPDYAPFLSAGIPEIHDMNVVTDLRCSGIGSRLVAAAEFAARERGARVMGIGVGVPPGYAIAQHLYPALGYVEDGRGVQPDQWGGTVFLARPLDAAGVVLETDRLRLREIVPADADALTRIFGDPRAMRFWPAVKTRPEVEKGIARTRDSYLRWGFGLWAAELRNGGEFVGRCGLIRQADVDGRDEVEVAYALVPRFWRPGYATEAAAACRDWALRRLGCGRVISLVKPENEPSRRVAERLGMRVERQIQRNGFTYCVYTV